MSELFRLKWRMIKQVIKCDDCILISKKDERIGYKFAGRSLMFAQLFHRLNTFVPNWHKQWLRLNTVKDETD